MKFSYQINSTDAGISIDAFLKKQGYSRRLIIALKESEDGIVIEKEKKFTNYKLKEGETLRITLPKEASQQITPVPLPFDVVFEDEHLIAVNKPADTPIHPSINNYENTLANAAAWYFEEKKEPFVFRCVNRLDRDTTGLVLLAKHALSGSVLSAMVKQRILKREYLAICEGIIEEKGSVSLPIGRLPGSAIMRCVDRENGDSALTHYEPIAWENGHTLLKIHLETGRTHQIRIHMGAMGHPLPGDYLYNPVYDRIGRQPLHSWHLTFPHPVHGTIMHLTAPVPDDMKALFPIFFGKELAK